MFASEMTTLALAAVSSKMVSSPVRNWVSTAPARVRQLNGEATVAVVQLPLAAPVQRALSPATVRVIMPPVSERVAPWRALKAGEAVPTTKSESEPPQVP